MRLICLIFLLCWFSVSCAQPTESSIESLISDFEHNYPQFSIPGLQLSYVGNLENVQTIEELHSQENFFKEYEQRLRSHEIKTLSDEHEIILRVLEYEIDLNLERIALQKKWLEANCQILGTKLYNECFGKEWYQYYLKRWVDKSLEPDEAFQFGLEEIAKIKSKMKGIKGRMNLTDSAFNIQWQDNRFLLFKEANILERYEEIQKRVQTKVVEYFPEMEDLHEINIAPGTNEAMAIAPAYYNDNTFFFNFFNEEYDRRDMGWVYLHEAIPGHHYHHYAIAKSNSTIQNLFFYMGFREGWAAYIEQYGGVLNAYDSSFDHYAQLKWDLIRSVRVALDVGLNYYGWSDERAMGFWTEHIKNEEEIARREIKRMKRWPAQVITYKYGMHVINELKADKKSPEELKRFHKEVLSVGDLPPSVLLNYLQEKER